MSAIRADFGIDEYYASTYRGSFLTPDQLPKRISRLTEAVGRWEGSPGSVFYHATGKDKFLIGAVHCFYDMWDDHFLPREIIFPSGQRTMAVFMTTHFF